MNEVHSVYKKSTFWVQNVNSVYQKYIQCTKVHSVYKKYIQYTKKYIICTKSTLSELKVG